MGQGYNYICKKCKYEYSVHFGKGMMYPTVYRSVLTDISEGKYGSGLKEIYDNTPYAAIDARQVVYICKRCSSWELGTDVTLYAPNKPDIILKKQYGIKTVAEWGYVPYVLSCDLKDEYHLLKRYYHHCCKCGRRMHKASFTELRNLSCPKCGSENQSEDFFMWD